MSKREKPVRRTAVGGQALIEGVMMRGVSKGAMAVRTKSGSIDLEVWELGEKKWYQKCPFVRGIFNFVLQLKDGMKYMNKSMEKSGYLEDEENEEPTKFEKWLDKTLGKNAAEIVGGIGAFVGVALAIVLFLFVPTWAFTGLQALFGETDISPFRSLFEGILKIAVYVAYLALTSLMKDIRRTYEYHGAEHKTIATYEAGEELTVENVKKHTRFHPRCGTSFIFLVLAVSILVTTLVPINSENFIAWFGVTKLVGDLLRIACKIILLPFIVGISYELIKIAGRYDNPVTAVISAPGLALQRLTTKEPDSKQIECAIAAIKPVLPAEGEDDRW
ncbi:MAG: DUF1385 domain-containing protein [Firmicutes bacterium]|nr:DUF1385 domain-containing protein [[Eubacterium] siraeum]MCM1487275.1 DUF1385 domain-containing protein [Bacillota bacterium]